MSQAFIYTLVQLRRAALFILFIILLAVCKNSQAQVSKGDSTAAQLRYQNELDKRDSILNAAKQARIKDSIDRVVMRQKAEAYRDSMRQAMIDRRIQDSIKREEIKAEILAERARRDSTRLAQRNIQEQLIEARKREADSLKAAREATRDSIANARAKAKQIRDDLAKYKNSKGYKDSIAKVRDDKREFQKAAREERLARLKAAREKTADSLKTNREAEARVRKAFAQMKRDSLVAARKSYNDSLKLARKTATDKLKLARQQRKDSLEKANGIDKTAKREKKTEDELLKERADNIHARKKGSWTNEKLLKKSWNIKRRIWQNTVTRYNSYYNAKRKYDDAMALLTDRKKEVYTEQITLRPYNLEEGITAVGGDMDTVIKKAAYDTQIHDPRSKWFDNLYLLMGKAFYHKNDYEAAITAFQYVVNEYKDGDLKKKQKKGYQKLPALDEVKFDKDNKVRLATIEKRSGLRALSHHSVRNDALIWLARAYTQNKQYGEAQSLLTILDEDTQFPDRLRDDLYFAMADLSMKQGNPLSAIEPLEKAVKQKDLTKTMRNRANYLLAQLHAENGNLEASNKYLNQTLKSKLPLEMEYFTKLKLAQNAIEGKGNKNAAIAQLESLAQVDKFTKWRGQTYLSLGQILQESKPIEAINFYNQSLIAKGNEDTKAAAFLGKGEIYYKQANYREAKIAYDSAVAFSKTANPPLKNMSNITLRQEVLTSLIKYTDIIELEDSLQALSKKSEREKIGIIKDELRRQQKERRKQLEAESTKLTPVALTAGQFGKNDWYFYNNTSVQQGLVEFKTKWGDRPLVDDWRRNSSKSLGGGADLLASDDSTTDGQNSEESFTRNQEVQQMLRALYNVPDDFVQSDKLIADAYFQLGLIYTSRLQEYKSSINTFEALNLRYPKHEQLAATYYSMILSNQELNNLAEAKKYQDKLNSDFSQTEFNKLASGTSEKQNVALLQVNALYDSAYQMLRRDEFNNALANATASLSNYPESTLRPKFELVQAKSLAGLKKYDSSIVVTENIIKSYPGTNEEKHAQEFLSYLVKATQLAAGVKVALGTDSSTDNTTQPLNPFSTAVYTYNKNQPHFYMIYITPFEGAIALKSGISDYNRLKHAQENLTTNMNLLDAKSAILSVTEFKNRDFAERYVKQITGEPNLFSNIKSATFKVMIISDDNFKELMKTRKIVEYLDFYNVKYN